MSDDHAPVLPARMIKTSGIAGLTKQTIKPRKPSLPMYGGGAYFRGSGK